MPVILQCYLRETCNFLDWISKTFYERLVSFERPGSFMWQNRIVWTDMYQDSEPFPILCCSKPSPRPRPLHLQKHSINERRSSFLNII